MNRIRLSPHAPSLEAELKQAKKELDAFVHHLSHDFKGPLARLEGVTQLIAAQNPTADIQFSIRLIEEVTQQMNQLVNELIYVQGLFQGESPKFELNPYQVIEESMARIQNKRRTGIGFRAEVNQPESWITDRALLSVIVEQLLSNAFIFHRSKGPERYVNLRLYKENQSNVVEVRDNGQGIPPQQMDRIFELFYKGSDSSRGSGIGLYLVRKAVFYLQGSIEVDSELGQGSTFRVYLPHTELTP